MFLLENSQVFDVVAARSENAMLTVEPVLYELLVGVDVVKNGVSIDLMARSEYDNLKVLIGLMETLDDIWSHIDTCIHSLFSWKVNFKNNICLLSFDIINTMNQSFIHVKNYKLFFVTKWQIDFASVFFIS